MSAFEPAIVMHSALGVIVGWDAAAERLLGYAANEVLGQPFSRIAPEDSAPHAPIADRTLVTKSGGKVRARCRRTLITDGTDRVIAVSEVMSPLAPTGAAAPRRAPPPAAPPAPIDCAVLLDAIPQLVWSIAVDGTIRPLSRRARQFSGDDAARSRFQLLVHPDDHHALDEFFHGATESAGERAIELRLASDGAQYRWFDVRIDRMPRDASWLLTATDIDAIHALREEARADQSRLSAIVATVPGAVLSYRNRPDGVTEFLFVSPGAQALYGYSPAELLENADDMLARLDVTDIVRGQQTLERAMITGEPWRAEYRYNHPTRGERWLETHFVPVGEVDGSAVLTGVVLDITQRKQGELKLAVTEAHLESALDAVQMGAWVWDTERNLVWGNDSQRRLWDLPPDTPTWYEPSVAQARIHPDDLPQVDETMRRSITTDEPCEFEFRIVRGGEVRWLAMRSRVEKGAPNAPRRLVGINIDITQQKLAAEMALRSQKLEALGTLAGGIAHDFNNVLFAISGNAAVALHSLPPNSPIGTFLREIASASSRASELVRQILAFSRPDEQRLEVLSLVEPVQEALKLARAAIPTMVTIQCTFERDLPKVRADASRIVQVVINLCTNAAHAIGRGQSGLIEVSLRPTTVSGEPQLGSAERVPKGHYALLTVSDNGSGMDEATQARIFDPFFTTKAKGEGTGLGLSVVHGIITALGGIITVYSQPNKGTRFHLYFPASLEPQAAPHVRSVAPRAGRGQRILFVDDELMLVHLGKNLLDALGYRPDAYQDASEALDSFRRAPNSYGAVVTDLSMPGMSGFDLTRKLRAIRRDLPIVVMSGYIGPDERATAHELGVQELVLKPISMNQLGELLSRLA